MHEHVITVFLLYIYTKIRLYKTQFLNIEANEDIAFLIDLNKAGKSSPEARKIWKELSEKNKNQKVAFIGLNPIARVIASFTIAFSDNNGFDH